MLRRRTVEDQLLPVLKRIVANVRGGLPIPEACHAAFHEHSKRLGVAYQTIEDLCRRRLALDNVSQFHTLIGQWIEAGSPGLKQQLLRQTDNADHDVIHAFFKQYTENAIAASTSEPVNADRGRKDRRLIVEGLDAETLTALDERAQIRGRSLESEVREILGRVVKEGRGDFGAWAKELRAKLKNRYVGDVTADIRADRDR